MSTMHLMILIAFGRRKFRLIFLSKVDIRVRKNYLYIEVLKKKYKNTYTEIDVSDKSKGTFKLKSIPERAKKEFEIDEEFPTEYEVKTTIKAPLTQRGKEQ